MAAISEAALFYAIRHPQKRAFLLAYSECLNVRAASQHAKIDRTLHYYWLKNDPAYVEAFAEAKVLGVEILEEEAVRRALIGSDTMLIFLLKGARPDKYRERYEHSGPGGGPMDIRVIYGDDAPATEPLA